MSANDWLTHISRLNFYAGQLASKGDQFVACAEVRELANKFERLSSNLGTSASDTFSDDWLTSPSLSVSYASPPVRFAEHFTPSNPPPPIFPQENSWPSRQPGGSHYNRTPRGTAPAKSGPRD